MGREESGWVDPEVFPEPVELPEPEEDPEPEEVPEPEEFPVLPPVPVFPWFPFPDSGEEGSEEVPVPSTQLFVVLPDGRIFLAQRPGACPFQIVFFYKPQFFLIRLVIFKPDYIFARLKDKIAAYGIFAVCLGYGKFRFYRLGSFGRR